jgi:TRAP-type mannitol/chloroaromatic compound transport system substrate-binding protein
MGGLFEVVAATEAVQQLPGNVRVVVAHACSSAVDCCYWQHAEAKNTRLYELMQQLVQTSLFMYVPARPKTNFPTQP